MFSSTALIHIIHTCTDIIIQSCWVVLWTYIFWMDSTVWCLYLFPFYLKVSDIHTSSYEPFTWSLGRLDDSGIPLFIDAESGFYTLLTVPISWCFVCVRFIFFYFKVCDIHTSSYEPFTWSLNRLGYSGTTRVDSMLLWF